MRSLPVVLLALVAGHSSAFGQSREVPGIGWHATGKQGAVCAGGAEAVAAGLATLKAGGNAIDGAVATIFAMTVTESDRTCFGGEVPFVIYDAKRNVVEVVCGLGTAPKLATREYFSKKKDGIPGKGLEPAAIPALVDGCLTALDRYGTITFAEAIKPTLGGIL